MKFNFLQKPARRRFTPKIYLLAASSFGCLALAISAVAFANPVSPVRYHPKNYSHRNKPVVQKFNKSGSNITRTVTSTKPVPTASPKAGIVAAPPTALSSAAKAATNVVLPSPKQVAISGVLYSDPGSQVALGARARAAANTARAGALQRLASSPMARWFGNWNSNIQADVSSYVNAAAAAGQIPQLVIYNIPGRDCGSYSSGGASDGASYANFINGVAAGIGSHSAIVVVEPDALALDCTQPMVSLSDKQRLISSAVHVLKSQTAASVYIDAGHANWRSADDMASRLRAANVGEANGFSLNVSNFYTTAENNSYGGQISRLIDNKHFVVDTSRNGNGATSDHQWCNPLGRSLGASPTLNTGNSLADAYLWIKGPGESDGSGGNDCASTVSGSTAPSAGIWWPEYAEMLLQNTNW